MESIKQDDPIKKESLCGGAKQPAAKHRHVLGTLTPCNIRPKKKYTQMDHLEICHEIERQVLRYKLRAAKAEALYSELKLKKLQDYYNCININ